MATKKKTVASSKKAATTAAKEPVKEEKFIENLMTLINDDNVVVEDFTSNPTPMYYNGRRLIAKLFYKNEQCKMSFWVGMIVEGEDNSYKFLAPANRNEGTSGIIEKIVNIITENTFFV